MKARTKILIVLVAIAALVQILLLFYKHFTGFVALQGPGHFLISFLVGTIGSVLLGAVLLGIDIQVIRWLDRAFPWEISQWRRPAVEVAGALVIGVGFGLVFTIAYDLLFSYSEPLSEVLLYNGIITMVVNFLIMTGTEGVFFYKRHQESLLQAEQLKRENLSMRFETLKKQLDPHFLFNSLNTLSSLIRVDPEKATAFIDEFSAVYRYTLEVIDEPVVPLEKELDFAHSYLYLQNIRFADAVKITIDVDESVLKRYVPPLSVQSLLENAFKHNTLSKANPLSIEITSDQDSIIVRNSLQLKQHKESGGGVGFGNLKSRYQLISGQLPEMSMTEKEYRVTLPFIETVS